MSTISSRFHGSWSHWFFLGKSYERISSSLEFFGSHFARKMLRYLACLDSFLNLFTILPLRVVTAILSLFSWRPLSSMQRCDLSRALLITFVSLVMLHVDMSQAYHFIRGQAVIKLYVVFNVLEIFDKLCASFGQVRSPRPFIRPASNPSK